MKAKVGAKISAGFITMLILIILLGVSSYVSQDLIKNAVKQIEASNQKMMLEMNVERNFTKGVSALRAYISYGDEKYYKEAKDCIEEAIKLEKQLHEVTDDEYKEKVQQLINLNTAYKQGLMNNLAPVIREYHKQLNNGNAEKANIQAGLMNAIANELIPMANQLSETITELTNTNNKAVLESINYTEMEADKVINVSIIMTIIAAIIGIVLSIFLTRMIRNPIMKMVSGAQQYANGDFTNEINVKSQDEIGELANALNKMQDNFKYIIENLTHSSTQLAGSSQQLMSQAQQTSAGVSETSSTMNEISSTMDNMSQNTQKVSIRAVTASEYADKGYQGIGLVNNQMHEITTATVQVSNSIGTLNTVINKIGQFVEAITNIAEQTNLLALNAAIESARAGEAGKGFAVVADEVRNLAEQSAQSANEITDLISEVKRQSKEAVQAIENGTEKVEQGNKIVNDVGDNFSEIIKVVQELSEQVQSVASSAQQVSAGIQNIAGTTEEQTASMEEVTAATEDLNKLAEELNNLVVQFKV